MRMKNRFCRMGKSLFGALCLLSTCGVTYSCSDDFDLDETKPAFLGQSIYDELKNRQDFTNVIRLIDDLDFQSVLSKTGSKTLFVANDSAYKKFFETTTWTDGNGAPVRSYEQLSNSQKLLLLNGSMLNNAYVLEMLTTIQGPLKNLCLRQLSSATATDSVPFFKWDELPNNLNKGQDINGKVIKDKRFWDRFRTPERGGIYMALDKTTPMMTHFLEGQMKEKKITHGDVSFILNLDATNPWTDEDSKNRSYIYDSEIKEADVTCLNGYYHVVDKVIVTPQNMAEIIRTNGQTNLFSQILDRFSAPYYDEQLTKEYKALHDIQADSVYQKLYISQRSQKGNITKDPDGNPLGTAFPSLAYDPGWNAYTGGNTTKEQDMAAMFVPSDKAMIDYFVHGGGSMMIARFGDKPNTEENLSYNLYQIPLDIIYPMVKNLMKESFNETVPSKYLSIMNDAQDPMFGADQYPSVDAYKNLFEKVLLANNGVVYVMKNVISPATYASVMAPVLHNDGVKVVNTVLHADDQYVSINYAQAPLRKFYSTYLLAMQSNFSLFAPTDEGLRKYGMVETMGFASNTPSQFRYWNFVPDPYDGEGKIIQVKAQSYRYELKKPMDAENARPDGPVSNAKSELDSKWGKVKKQLLTDMIDQHIIVHELGAEGELGVHSGHNFYLSRSGAPVQVKVHSNDPNKRGEGMVLNGGLQMYLNHDDVVENDFDCKVTKGFDQTRGTNAYGNGRTYFLDRPMQATLFNTYQVFSKTSQYKKFFELCQSLDNESSLIKTLFGSKDKPESELELYKIFAPNTKDGRITAKDTRLVRFFNNYRYTVFVPSNEAVQRAIDAGLPTLEDIKKFVEENTTSDTLNAEAKVKAQAMLTCYVNFLKYHFCDKSYFVDNYDATSMTQTACTDESTGNIVKVLINQSNEKMSVKDAAGKTVDVQAPYNQVARDFQLDEVGTKAHAISASSYVVLHGVNNYLLFDKKLSNGFAAAWNTPEKAKAFVKQYRLKK